MKAHTFLSQLDATASLKGKLELLSNSADLTELFEKTYFYFRPEGHNWSDIDDTLIGAVIMKTWDEAVTVFESAASSLTKKPAKFIVPVFHKSMDTISGYDFIVGDDTVTVTKKAMKKLLVSKHIDLHSLVKAAVKAVKSDIDNAFLAAE